MKKNGIGKFFANQPGIVALYSGRIHGNMKFTEYKEGEANRNFFRENFLGSESRMAFARVDHGKKVMVVKRCGEESVYRVDGLVAQEKKDLYLALTFADCPFVMLADPVKKIIGLAHCGWKPMAQDILYKVFNEMLLLGSRRQNMLAAIGPGICATCYEFDKETAMKNFGRIYKNFILPSEKDGKCQLDLRGIIRSQLADELEIPRKNIENSRHCTCCEKERFFSYRGEKMNPEFVKAGIAVIGLKQK